MFIRKRAEKFWAVAIIMAMFFSSILPAATVRAETEKPGDLAPLVEIEARNELPLETVIDKVYENGKAPEITPMGFRSMGILGEGGEYTWNGDATEVDLTGFTAITVKKGAKGKLNLVEQVVSIDVEEIEKVSGGDDQPDTDIYAEAEIIAGAGVAQISLSASAATTDLYPKFKSLSYEGAGDFVLVLDTLAFGFGELNMDSGNLNISASGGVLGFDSIKGNIGTFQTGGAIRIFESIEADITTFTVASGDVYVQDGILGNLDTLNVKGSLDIRTKLTSPYGDNPDTEAANPGIASVKNINVNSGGYMQVSCGNNSVSNTVSPNAINLVDGGKIDINGGILKASGSSGEYASNPANAGGAGIYALGSGEMTVRNGSVLAQGGSSTTSNTDGAGLKAVDAFNIKLYGGNEVNDGLVSLKGSDYSPATMGNITAHFNIGGGEPSLELKDGGSYTGESSPVNINGNFPGVFEIDEDEFDITGDPSSQVLFSVKPKNGGGKISFTRPLSNNLYIYAGTDENNPTANQEFTISKSGEDKTITTGTNGRAMFPFSEDEEYSISYDSKNFNITIAGNLFTAADLPAGISIIDRGNGLQILPNGEEITFTAEQMGGVSNETNSAGILLTFSKEIASLPAGVIFAEGITFGTPNDNNDSDNKTWYIPITDLGSINDGHSATINLANWSKYKVTNTASVNLYKRGGEITFDAEENGGVKGLTDSSGILLTFTQDVEGLTTDKITLSGDGVSGSISINAVEKQEEDLKTWLVKLNISDSSEKDAQEISIKIDDFNGYLFPTEPTKVEIYRAVTKKITYTAETIGGISDIADTTAIRIKLSGFTNGFSEDSVVFEDTEGTELIGIVKGQLKYEGLEGVQEVYTLPISGEFENGQEITVVLNPWQSDIHYTIADGQTAQTITLYKDTREELTFSLEQVGGISNQLRTQYIKITFNKAVKGLTISDITPSLTEYGSNLEAVNPDVDGKSTTWKLTARGFGVDNGKEFSLIINNFGTYKLDDNNRTQKVVVYDSQYSDNSFYLEQVGGLNKLEDTESINISFRLGVNLTSANIKIEGAQKGELTKVDTEGLLWNLKISGINENNKKVKIKIIDPGESFWLTTTEKEITVYKDTRYYIDYKFEEIGGINGEKNTEAFKITFTDKEGKPLSKEIETLYLRNVYWQGTQLDSPQKVEDEKNSWLLPVAHFNRVKNGDTVTMDLKEIKVAGETVELIEPHKEAKIYLDARVKVWLYGGAYDGKKGIETTKYLFFPGDKLTFEDFKKEDFKLEGADLVRLVKPEGLFGSWYILLEIDNIVDDDNDGQAEVKLTVLNQPKGYVVVSHNDEQTIRVYKDTRKHLTYEIIEVGGTKDKKTTEFVKVKFNQEVEWQDFHRVNLMNALNDKLIDMEMPIEIDTDGRTVEFPVIATGKFENGDKAYLNIIPTREGGVVVDTERQVFTLHKKVASQGKRIETVSPSIIYNGSEKKILTLIGYFGTDGAKGVKSIILRDKNNTSNAREIVLDHWGKNYNDEAQLRQKLNIDLSKIEMLNTVGEYEIAFRGKDGYFSEYAVLRISNDEMYSTDAYGILAVTQRSDKSFAVETFPSEALMNSNKTAGTTLVTLRGNISRIEDNYLIKGDSVLNKAIDYIPSGDSSILIGPKSGGIYIKADKGQLKWNGIEVSAKGFSIDLSSSKKYRNKRTVATGDNVELIGSLQEFNFDALAFSVEVGTYKLYEDEFSMSGRIAIGEALPNFMGEAGAAIALEELLLQNKGLGIPPMKASGNIGFSPSEMFGDFVGASGGLGLELNTLPEAPYNYLKGEAELDISDVIYLQGELVFAWGKSKGKMYFTPDTLKFFGRIGEGGIPLVPPVVVAYINGVGGGVSGIADIVSKNYGRIPPLELSISGAISDVSGFIASVDKATITIGPKIFSAKADEMTLLKIVKLFDVGIAMGLTENQIDDKFLDAFFEAGGHINILNGTITGGLNVSAQLYGYQMGQAIKQYMDEVNKNGFKAPSGQVGKLLYEAFDVEGEIYAGVHAKCFLGEIDGKGWLYGNKVLLSGGVSGYVKPFWGTEYAGSVWVKYYFADGKVKFSQNNSIKVASLGMVAINPQGQEYIVAQGDDGELMVLTNIENLGTFYPGSQKLMARGIMGAGEPLAGTSIPGLKAGAIVVIQAEDQYPSIAIYKDNIEEDDEPYHIMVTSEWAAANYDFPELAGKGRYLVQYQIPEDGDYRFVADGSLTCTVAGLAAMPQFDSISIEQANKKVTWQLNDEADKKINDLYVRLNLVDAETGSNVSNLTLGKNGNDISTSIKASPKTFTYELPSTLESGKYYISAKLFEIKNNEEIVLDVAHTEEFDHTSTTTIATVNGIITEYVGNGVFKVSWNKVNDADGYVVTIVDTYGNKLAGIAEINVKSKDKDNKDVTSAEILAGLYTLIDEETKVEIVQGIEFAKDYQVSVKAYKNKTYSFGESNSHIVPIYGEPGYGDLKVPEPKIPQLSVYPTGANEVREEDGSSIYYADNNSPTFELAFDTNVVVPTVSLKGESIDLTNNVLAYNYPADGNYLFDITATNGKDTGYYGLNVVIDTKAPVLQVDGDSFMAFNRRIAVNGYTEVGATVESNLGQAETSGSLFTVSGEMEGESTALVLTATDKAGNYTERILNLVYADAGPENGGGSSSSGGTSFYEEKPPAISPPAASNIPVSRDKDGNVKALLTDEIILDAYNKALEAAEKEGAADRDLVLVLNISLDSADINSLNINLPLEVQASIIEKGIGQVVLQVTSAQGLFIKISLDLATIKEIQRQAGADATLSVTPLDKNQLTAEAQAALGNRPVFDLRLSYGSGSSLRDFDKGRVVISIPYTKGSNEEAERLQGVYIDDEGKVKWIINSFYDEENKLLNLSTHHFSSYGLGYKKEGLVFTDIESHWAKEAIAFVAHRGLFSGTSPDKFSPDLAITRGMFVTVLGRMADADVSAYKVSSFTDVEKDSYYQAYIEWAKAHKIVSGLGEGIFAPEAQITREQMATIIDNYNKYSSFKLPAVNAPKSFADNDQISPYAKAAVEQMQKAGIISGKNGNLFDPQGRASRAEVSSLLSRYIRVRAE